MFTRSGSADCIGFSDADWAGDIDDRKSTSGYLFQVGGASISWKSKKQSCVALSMVVSFPDPAFKLDKGLAHFARNLGLPDLAGKEESCDNKYIHDSGWGLELKRGLGQRKVAGTAPALLQSGVRGHFILG